MVFRLRNQENSLFNNWVDRCRSILYYVLGLVKRYSRQHYSNTENFVKYRIYVWSEKTVMYNAENTFQELIRYRAETV